MTPEHFAYIVGTLMISIIGFFIVRAIDKNDKVIDDHEHRLNEHEELIQKMMGQLETMQKINNMQYAEVNKKLDYITEKIESYDEGVKEFYKTYELVKK
ncbi:hypothetical protein UFOVP1015_30 [uncultured Caudovirales phage]|uniref:Uncharacterized protein n=1 Tax=uncultured Caudovirales phage TaxID=2100421 RepID=A0A6J5Q6Q1_9CAUD|nr:hypothetical protein UFOVP1015_30 [uncultured Caudovirales phage]CAB5229210.1 hypothetical protein UFOVP1551_11 [uncultured Caudovirales phage]